ncbi:DUF1302 domain-containing protein [Parendozoicomonas haliclonae]|uniref:Uncharacterized protein n=1 Tax=Parendozoicomonas haliclonae TaxID=1960125 RepID=A0A1X7AM82_9GAMM|nr:DUF1302 domain-containing protein [Parendozoicomonas haliclonae]SMA49269.1 hypothetical protein EHSB41UT_03150 [Parendozoicomonas haliclonae]
MKLRRISISSPMHLAPAKAGFALASILAVSPANAIEFDLMDGEVAGSLDTTVSYGAMWRVQGQDKDNDGINGNDGNRNYDTGLVSQVYKVTSDLSLSWENYGLFARGTAFHDAEMNGKTNFGQESWHASQPSQAGMQGSKPANRFTKDAEDISGQDAQLLDAYVYGYWDLGEMPVDARLGKQVLSWGEGMFYRSGINTTNPIDAARFRLPGSELKEALVPVETLSLSVGLTDNLSANAFYQWNFRKTQIDPVGTYFAETDLFAEGGNTAYNELGSLAGVKPLYDQLAAGGVVGGSDYLKDDGFKVAAIGSDINAKDDGQFGISFRYIAEELNDTEFGFYFVNYHAKEPVIFAQIDDGYNGVNVDAIKAAAVTPTVLQAFAGANTGGDVEAMQRVLATNPAVKAQFDGAVAALSNGQAIPGVSEEEAAMAGAQAAAAAGGVAAIDLGSNLTGHRKYLEDIRMYGVSFSTTFGNTSFAGELAYRPNMPITISATDDLIGDALAQAGALSSGATIKVADQMVNYANLRDLNNYERVESYNISLSAIHSFGPMLSFDSLFGVVEVASEHLRGSDLEYTDQDGNVRKFAGRGDCEYASSNCDEDDQIDADAFGYSAVLAGTWNDVYAGVNLNPYIRWNQNVKGNSHRTGNFLKGASSTTLGMKAQYLDLEAELQYTEFNGPDTYSQRDRDNVSIGVKYSF